MPPQPPDNRHAYIPPDAQAAMAQHMQRSMPAHLAQYQKSGEYIPQHVQTAMTEHLQKTLPAHLQQYAGAYVQQSVMSQQPAGQHVSPGSPQIAPHVPVTSFSPSPQNHFQPSGEQQALQQQPVQPQHVSPEQSFDFIMKPEMPVVKRQLPGGSSMAARLALVFGGLLILVIVFAVFKSLLGGSSNLTSFVAVAQDQQELIHLTTNATANNQSSLSTDDQNFTATAQLSLTSAQTSIATYLQTNGMKAISPKILNLKVSLAIDNQLTAAITADTYDQTYQQIMKNQLAQYQADLNDAYQKITGVHGRALLKSDYHQAQLLTTQLNAASTTG